MAATSITIHNTGNPSSSARNERGWLTNPVNDRTASFHLVVDENEAIECIPLAESAWHAGDGSGAVSGNRTSIAIEICESGRYDRTLDNAVELVARLLRQRGWGIDRLRRHYDWSGKICPRLMYDDGKWTGWATFKQRVAGQLQLSDNEKVNVRIVVNGAELSQHGKLEADTALVPVRAISEGLGAQVRWDQASKTVYIDK